MSQIEFEDFSYTDMNESEFNTSVLRSQKVYCLNAKTSEQMRATSLSNANLYCTKI